jgi:hypothetical protein
MPEGGMNVELASRELCSKIKEGEAKLEEGSIEEAETSLREALSLNNEVRRFVCFSFFLSFLLCLCWMEERNLFFFFFFFFSYFFFFFFFFFFSYFFFFLHRKENQQELDLEETGPGWGMGEGAGSSCIVGTLGVSERKHRRCFASVRRNRADCACFAHALLPFGS